MQKAYSRINWENYPSDKTPVNEPNLNKIDAAMDEVDNRVITIDAIKADLTQLSTLFKDVSWNESTGIITFTRFNGATITIDTKLERLAVNFSYDAENERLVITLDDGTVQYVDMSSLITQYEFLDSDTVAFQLDGTGKVSAVVKEGSIQEKHLQPNYLADIKLVAAEAEVSALRAEESATAAEMSVKAAQDCVDEAESYATKAEQAAASAGWAEFDIDENGHLIFTKTDNLETEFTLTENGRLEVTLL